MATFTASRLQIATYLLGVCPFSIAFLVFLNSSVSFVITDLIGQDHAVGDAVGNLGFADELVAIIACPIWGLLSDRIGVRSVCILGYVIIALALILFVQARNVYPDLLLGRLFFSVGGAAASTMVTAVLPTMSYLPVGGTRSNGATRHAQAASIASELTITPARYQTRSGQASSRAAGSLTAAERSDSTSRVAGFVGMATGCGALLALALFLPLPARFQKSGIAPGPALQYSYYTVAVIAIVLAFVCLIGLRDLQSESNKGWTFLMRSNSQSRDGAGMKNSISEAGSSLRQALLAGFKRADIFMGYLGGFVARSSSVAISLFIPLLVNAAFLSSGMCAPEGTLDRPAGLPDIKRKCPRAYIVAAELTGVSQMIALLCAPIFGYLSARTSRKSLPLMIAAAAGIIGYPLFATQFRADDNDRSARIVAFIAVALIGISQIGAIVCSLGTLSGGILSQSEEYPSYTRSTDPEQSTEEGAPLLESHNKSELATKPLADLKGSVAGIYSFYGGTAILILTKAGGSLFDSVSTGAPFYMMAAFNGILLVACLCLGFKRSAVSRSS